MELSLSFLITIFLFLETYRRFNISQRFSKLREHKTDDLFNSKQVMNLTL